MKKIAASIVIALSASVSNAQVLAPQASTHASMEETVGLTTIKIDYSRPKKNDRVIFGNVVPFDNIWRMGANKNTTIEFSDDVMVEGKALKAGKYALYTTPGQKSWIVYFYTESDNWGVPKTWSDDKIAAKVEVKSFELKSVVEVFTISVDDLTINSALLNFAWDKTGASLKIEVPTDEKVMASIKKTMKGDPTSGDYMAAANYYANNGKDIKQAKNWMDKGMALNKDPQYYHFRQQSLIYAKSGDYKGAIELAKKSLEAAKAAEAEEYVKMNKESIEEWSQKK